MTHGSVIPKGVPFGQLPHACNEDPMVTNAAYRVYGQLVKLANSESRAWPGHRYLSDVLPMSRPTVAAALANLEDTGWLEIHKEKQHHTYTVVFEQARLGLDWSRNITGEESSPVKESDLTGKGTSPALVKELDRTDTQERQPERDNHSATNVAWEFLTDPRGFGMATETPAQRKRVGRLAREINAKLGDGDQQELRRRAATWPRHFPDAVMTAEAFEKHFELLGAPPLKRSKAETERERTRAALRGVE